jgi:preprotein translocase subunit SecY
MASGYVNIPKIPELRHRILITLIFLGIYRIGVHVPTPGVNSAVLVNFFAANVNNLFGFFNMFSGGALQRFSVFTLGVMPYISSSIIFQLLTVVVPKLEQLSKEGEAGRKKITTYTRYGTVVIAAIQSLGIAVGLEAVRGPAGEFVVLNPGWGFRILAMVTLTSGTAFLMWLGEQITERGIGNGISLIIASGIIARMPSAMTTTVSLWRTGEIQFFTLLILIAIMLLVVAAIIFFERAHRRIPIQYAKRVVGRKMYGGQSTHLPLKINTAGVIPPIFASSLIVFPATLTNVIHHPIMQKINAVLQPSSWFYNVLYVLAIVFFCYFYTAVTFNPVDVADNLKKFGGYIPGLRPGKNTSEYIDKVLTRITLGGAIYISTICVLPTIFYAKFNVPFYFGGTGLIIAVGVALDTAAQIESHLLARHYDGLLGDRKARFKGRKT